MTVFQRSLRNDIIKVFLSSAWVAVVAFGFQHYAVTRTSASRNAKVFAVSAASRLDPTILSRILSENGLLEVTAESSQEAGRTAEFLDVAVKNLGLNHVTVSALPTDRAAQDIRLELAKLGYGQTEITALFHPDRNNPEQAVGGDR